MKKLLLAILFLTGLLPASAYTDLDSGMRIFLTRDPAGFVDGPNLYTYVKQNPWTSFDPEGLEAMSSDAPTNEQIQKKVGQLNQQIAQADKAVADDNKRASMGDAMPNKSLEDSARALHQQKDFLVKVLEVRARLGDNGYGEWTTNSEIAKTFGDNYGENVMAFFKPASGWFVPEGERRSLDAWVAVSKASLSLSVGALTPEISFGGLINGGGALQGANYAQKTYGEMFSSGGTFAGRSIDDVAAALRAGQMKASDVPIQYVVKDGQTLILNTRSAQALERAGIPRGQWNAVDVSGDAAAQARLSGQLQRNGLGGEGTPTVNSTGH